MAEMRKQRKMGHITIVGPSMGIVEARLHSLLGEESVDDQSSGQLLHCGLITASCSLWNLMLLKFCYSFFLYLYTFLRCAAKNIYILHYNKVIDLKVLKTLLIESFCQQNQS